MEASMSSLTPTTSTHTRGESHSAGVGRIVHWINAVAIILMIMSGWQIYNASPLFNSVSPPAITLGGWLGGALLWHFAAMWLLMVNGLVYLTLGFATGRFRQKAAADHAVGRDRRHQGGADRQAVA
jgi:thiosulfate reductase cytochrome b subunit